MLTLADFTIKAHDTWPPIHIALTDADGAVDLTGADVKILLKVMPSGSTLIEGVCDIVGSPANGLVKYDWDPADTAVVNTYSGEIEVTWSDATITTFPNDAYFSVEVKADLG